MHSPTVAIAFPAPLRVSPATPHPPQVITSKEKSISKVDPATGEKKVFHTRIWNATVANLTLMALGSSAPEILLNVIEVLGNSFNSGALGPSTIVGSAAFNLMVITAVCMVCLPAGEVRVIKQQAVFLTTAFYSIFVYIWLLIIVVFWTPEVITLAEGIITCIFMVTLLAQAYWADTKFDAFVKKYTSVGVNGLSKKEAAEAIKAAHLGKDATPEELAAALKEMQPPKSRAYYRAQAAKGVSGKHKQATKVVPGQDDTPAEGQRKKLEPEAGDSSTAVDAESPGIIKWKHAQVDVMESGGHVTLQVVRVGGSKGAVSCEFKTKNQKAVAGKDYEAKEGKIEFADGDMTEKTIEIAIYDDDEFEKDEEFTVVLSEPTGGAKFEKHTDGGEDTDVCTVMIVNDDDRATKLTQAISLLKLDADALDLAGTDYKQQIIDAFHPDEEGPKAMAMHILTLPWKILFALVPPPGLFSGWPCFFLALFAIGFQVILISDFASQMGCQMYIKESVTAITFVALGTSLPDTFASMQAAVQDKYADNSIGNVTGSNSVNVLLGLGLPWLVGAIYWAGAGANAAWVERYNPDTGLFPLPKKIYDEYSTSGAFVVRSGDLGFSVIVFTVCAIITIGMILVRRKYVAPRGANHARSRHSRPRVSYILETARCLTCFSPLSHLCVVPFPICASYALSPVSDLCEPRYGQELGGNRTGAIVCAIILVMLWFVYILCSCLSTYGFITLAL